MRHVGKQAIRAALEPQFRGRWGVIRFYDEDLIVDEPQQRAVRRPRRCALRPTLRPTESS